MSMDLAKKTFSTQPDYLIAGNAEIVTAVKEASAALKRGAPVVLNSDGSANSTVGKPCKPGKAKVTQVYQPLVSRHPYHLVAVSGGGSTVYGWVDAADIKTEAAALAVGDQVTMDKAATVYGTTRKFSSWVYSAKLYVRAISGDRISVSTLKSGAITGNVDKKYLTKV